MYSFQQFFRAYAFLICRMVGKVIYGEWNVVGGKGSRPISNPPRMLPLEIFSGTVKVLASAILQSLCLLDSHEKCQSWLKVIDCNQGQKARRSKQKLETTANDGA